MQKNKFTFLARTLLLYFTFKDVVICQCKQCMVAPVVNNMYVYHSPQNTQDNLYDNVCFIYVIYQKGFPTSHRIIYMITSVLYTSFTKKVFLLHTG